MALQSSSHAKFPAVFQQIIGNKITQLVLWGTIIIGGVGVVFAIIALNGDEQKVKTAFSILQYVIGVLLPLWGTWIGTVLAYYYSKENFESANKSVQQIVDKLTSEKKLATVKAIDTMIAKENLIKQMVGPGEDLTKFKLKEDCIDFVETNKIKRVIILDDKDCAKYVIHRDLISFFITNEIWAGGDVKDLSLKDMYEKGNPDIKSTMDNSVKFIGKNANLLEAKNLMQQYKTCQDVFITENGNPAESILGWITNVTISENSIV